MRKRALVVPIVGVLIIVIIVVLGSFSPLISILNPSTGVIKYQKPGDRK